jgi:hypothetical protein
MQLVQRHRLNKLQSYSLPSDKYINLTLGASGITYTAPADGWFYLSMVATDINQYMDMSSQSIGSQSRSSAAGNYVKTIIPVKKMDTVDINYNILGSVHLFRFIYALGSQPA